MIQALRHTPYTSAKFKTFSIEGEYRLNEFLADTGLPLQQCEQNYQSMDLAHRQDLAPGKTELLLMLLLLLQFA